MSAHLLDDACLAIGRGVQRARAWTDALRRTKQVQVSEGREQRLAYTSSSTLATNFIVDVMLGWANVFDL